MSKAKANASQGIPELIQVATNGRFSANTKKKHEENAKYGWYRYEVRFALPVYNDRSGQVERYNIYSANILIRHTSDNKKYLLYISIKKREKYRLECEQEIIYEEELLKMNDEEIRQQFQYSSVIIFGGIGFSGLNKEHNASIIRYGKSFDELPRKEALEKDIQEANRINTIYTKLLKAIPRYRVIIFTHTEKEDWNDAPHNPDWIYINGHNHINYFELSDRCTTYADNQIGYKSQNIGLRYFYCDNDYDLFANYLDGIYEITKEQYIEFNIGKGVQMSFKRDIDTIYMLKKNKIYMFVVYCMYSKRSKDKCLCLLDGAKLKKLERGSLEDLSYYYDHIGQYAKNVHKFIDRYTEGQRKISKFIRSIGGSGNIHGCIIDVDNHWRAHCHLFVNPNDGTVTPYYAYDKSSRYVYKDFKTLLQAYDSCKLIADNYLQLEWKLREKLPMIRYSKPMKEWGNRDRIYDDEYNIYRISEIIKSLQYCTEKNIVRVWNEKLLNYSFENWIE